MFSFAVIVPEPPVVATGVRAERPSRGSGVVLRGGGEKTRKTVADPVK